ncbi:MAG: tetratricopeptide repeat protein [Coriobacteriia bacterium]|nr:tetratricopeptide repeat protein [Coriobacteriia bacterium]
MDPLSDGGVDAPAPASAPDGSTDPRVARGLTIAVWSVGVVLVAFAAFFAYNVYAAKQAENAASPSFLVIQALQKQVDAKPQDQTLRSRLAEALGAAGRFDEAKAQLAAAIKLDPKYVGAYQNLAQIELLQKEYGPAETHLKKLLELSATGEYQGVNQRRELAFFHLGEIALIQKRWEDAIGYFKSAIRMRKDASDTYLRLGQAYLGLGDKGSAREQIGIALKFDPRFPEALFEMGKLDLAAGDKVNAAWNFRASLDAMPDAQPAQDALDSIGTYTEWYAKAVEAFKAGRFEDAHDAVRISRALDPTSFDAAMLHGQVLEKLGDPTSAVDAYTIALKTKPDDKAAADALKRAKAAAAKKKADK